MLWYSPSVFGQTAEMPWDSLLSTYDPPKMTDTAAVISYVDQQWLRAEDPKLGDKPFEALEILLSVYPYEPYLPKGSILSEHLNRAIGVRLRRLGAHKSSIYFFERALKSQIEGRVDDQRRYYSLASELAGALLDLQEYQKAKSYYRRAFEAVEPTDTFYRAGMANNLGLVSAKMGQIDSARYFYKLALRLAEPHDAGGQDVHLEDLEYAARDNLGILETEQGNYQQARYYYEQNLRHKTDYMIYPHRPSQTFLRLAELELKLNQPGKANVWLQRAQQNIDTCALVVKSLHQAWLLRMQVAASDASNSSGDIGELMDAYVKLRDNEEKARRAGSERSFERLIALQRQQLLQARELEAQAQEQRQQDVYEWRLVAALIGLTLTALLVIIWAFVYTRNQRLRKAQEQERERNKRLELQRNLLEAKAKEERLASENLQLELQMRERDLQTAANFFSMQERLSETFMSKLSALKTATDDPEVHAQIQEALSELRALKPTEEKTQLLAEQLTDVNADFNAALQEQFPGLSTNDLELCSLIRLGLGQREQAMLRGVSDEGIRKARYRLSKRLGLERSADLDQFIRQLN